MKLWDKYSGEVAQGNAVDVMKWSKGMQETFEGKCEFVVVDPNQTVHDCFEMFD